MKNTLLDNFALANLKKGIARKIGTPPKQMRPLTCEMFLQMYNHLCFLNPKDIAFWAVCMIGFFGFLRKATLLPASAENKTDDCLLYGDLELIGFLDFNLHVRRTKTIQCRERILTLPYTACKGSPLCPVSALRSLMFVSPRDKKLSLFAYKTGGQIKWWNHSSFVNRLRDLLEECGYPPKEYSCHSFRRGGATLAFRLGMTLTEIKRRGDWRSNVVEEYVVLDRQQDIHIASKLVHGARLLMN